MDPDNSSSQQELEKLKYTQSLALILEQEKVNIRLEKLKHELSMNRESAAQEVHAREMVFQEAGQSIRSLNVFMWQVPGIAIAVTGGLWYGASTIADGIAKIMVCGFACAIDTLLIGIIWRIRLLIDRDVKLQNDFRKSHENKGSMRFFVIIIWTILLLGGAFISFLAALFPNHVTQNPNSQSPKGETKIIYVSVSDPTENREISSPTLVNAQPLSHSVARPGTK